jgi:peptidoglycan/xylan/chitin deacetylase (PgdA/CDA1 family)
MAGELWQRVQGKWRRTLAATLSRRVVQMRNSKPIISFTFDDFPKSAIEIGGTILQDHGVFATYYVALGLLDRDEAAGRICSAQDVRLAVQQGHELGCHTFGHCDPWDTEPDLFEQSLEQNQRALSDLLPETKFHTMSYPISTTPRPITKHRTGRRFSCCRAGGYRINVGTVDLNYVHSFFLERYGDRIAEIDALIDRNRTERGWLIFSTHDITSQPTQYGCTPEFFTEVVRLSVRSGARVLPVEKALLEVDGPLALCP